ncbi:MAG: hypothetical protein ACMVY4_09510 [Minwuia sp.]|uniref:hypothetical protein n=1 Tax=Minwuia sp. TaxID=2493630 RepID=UPI003A8A8A18
MSRYTLTLTGLLVVLALVVFVAINRHEQRQQSVDLEQLVRMLGDTVNGVEKKTAGDPSFPNFRHADLELLVEDTTQSEASGSLVVFSGGAEFTQSTSTRIVLRLKPAGAPVSEIADRLSDRIVESARRTVTAAAGDFELSRLEATWKLVLSESYKSGTELKADDIGIAASTRAAGTTGNAMTLVFSK